MSKDNKHTSSFFSRLLKRVLMFVPTIIGTSYGIANVIGAETMLAKKNATILLSLGLTAFVLLLSTWLCLLGILFFAMLAFSLSPIVSFFILLLINIILFLLLLFVIFKIKNRGFFPLTAAKLKRFTLL